MKRAVRILIVVGLIGWGLASLIPPKEPPPPAERRPPITRETWLFVLPLLGMVTLIAVMAIALRHQKPGLHEAATVVLILVLGGGGLGRLTWWCCDLIPDDD